MNEQCPVCQLPTEKGQDSDFGERKYVHCSCCGPFEISRTALAMLNRRLKQDILACARLSHAIRSRTSEDNWLFVSSTNLDELVQQPLPGIPQQRQNLIMWLATQLGDDRLGGVPTPCLASLAGLVGAAGGDRVQRLVDYAAREGFIYRDVQKDMLGLSPEGWKMLELSKGEEASDKQTGTTASRPETIKAHCNTCGGDRHAYRRATHTVQGNEDEVSWSDTYDILECCGCSNVSVRHVFWFSEWDQFEVDSITGKPRLIAGERVAYWPPETTRKKPIWAEALEDDVLRRVFDEVYQALNSGMIVLAAIGTRTLLDRAMFLRIGEPGGGFYGKLKLMLKKGHIGEDEREILEAITDAGSAAAHRGFAPGQQMLATIVETTENFLHREFVLKTAAGEIRAATPPRTAGSRGM